MDYKNNPDTAGNIVGKLSEALRNNYNITDWFEYMLTIYQPAR